MKLIFLSALFFALLSKTCLAKPFLNKSEIVRKSNQCLKDPQFQLCSRLISEIEQLQLVEAENNSYKCQSSILGLQTELIKANYFKKLKKNQNGIMIPYVIKNC